MNCEQVEEQLSAYLDTMLAPAERREVTLHLQACPTCMASLAELRQNDIFLARLPRVGPTQALRERLFALPEMRDLVAAAHYPVRNASFFEQTQPLPPSFRQISDRYASYSQPLPVPFSEERGQAERLQTRGTEIPPTPPTVRLHPSSSSYETRQIDPPRTRKRQWTPLKLALVAALLLLLGAAGVLSFGFRRQPASSANLAGAITPPSGPATGQVIPLAAGSRFVFLRDGALWSTLVDGSSHQPERLTPAKVTVASGWLVSPAQGNHNAGSLVAYIDLQSARVHTIRSDGQEDTSVGLTLMQGNNAALWQSVAGQVILKSLAWSPDSSLLAFVADPTGSGQDGLYLFTRATDSVRAIATNLTGSIAHPIWSPDGTRLAFTLTTNGVVSVQDYNVQSRSALDLSNLAGAQGSLANDVLSLNWFANAGQEAVTWCLGSIGHIRSIWLHRVGADSTVYPQQLLSGDYLQAAYTVGSNNATGGWFLVASVAGRAGDIWRLDLTPGGQLTALSQGKQVSFARWSPDGSTIFYLDGVSNGLGRGHIVNVLTGNDQLLADQVAASPAPDWSADGLQLAYSTGTQIDIVQTLNGGQLTRLHPQGRITNLSWSPSALHQLIVSFGGATPGLYLFDTRQNTARQLDNRGSSGEIQWTEIP